MLEITLWGDPHVRYDGKPWPMQGPPRMWSLLALLVLHRQPILRTTVAPLLWPDAEDSEALANLRRHVHRLTRALPAAGVPWILLEGKSIGWNRAAATKIDAVEFQKLVNERNDRDVVDAYGGELLAGSFDESILELREDLRAAYLDALARLIERARTDGDLAAAQRFAERLLAEDEWREDAVRSVMAIRYERGDRPGAISVYERFADALRRELRAQPMAETTALRDAILSGSMLQENSFALRTEPGRESGTAFVGRSLEMQTVRNAWTRAARGRGSVLLVAGEPGIGKSRLALELCATVEAQRGSALLGRTSSPEAGAFQSILEAIRDGLPLLNRGDVDDHWLAPLVTVLPEIERLAEGDLRSGDVADTERGRGRLQESIARVVAAMAARRPLVIVLEDLHWAETDTLELVEMLAYRVASLPILLVATYRPGDLGPTHRLLSMRRSLQHARRGQTIALARLAQPELAELARSFLGRERPNVELVQRLTEISEGNPLFAVQVMRYFSETGEVPNARSALASIADTVVSRLERLSPEARAIASVAASINGDFTIEEVASVGGWEESIVLDALGLLLDARIVCERGGERFAYGFTHALIESAIRDAATTANPRARSYRIAEVLSATRDRKPGSAALIGSHWEAAGEPERAAKEYLRAANVAMERFAWGEAVRLGRRAVELGLPPAQRVDALIAIGEASLRQAQGATIAAEMAEMQRLAKDLDPERQLAALLLATRCAIVVSDRAAQLQGVDELVRIVEDGGNDRGRGEVYLIQAKVDFMTGRLPEAETKARSAIALALSIQDGDLALRARENLVQNLMRQGKVDEGRAEVEAIRAQANAGNWQAREMLAIALVRLAVATQSRAAFVEASDYLDYLDAALGDVRIALICKTELAYHLHQQGDTTGARASYRWAIESGKTHGVRQSMLVSTINLGCVEREVGHFDRAEALWKQARQIAKLVNSGTSLTCCAINLAELELARGRAANALKDAKAGVRMARACGVQSDVAEGLGVLGAVECAIDDPVAGLAHLREGLALRRTLKAPRWLGHELCVYVETLLALGELGEATAVAGELRELFDREPNAFSYPGRVCLALAAVESANGREGEASKLKERGRRSVEHAASRMEPDDRAAFSALPHNRILLTNP